MEFLASPWEETFLDFVRSIDRTALIVSPYISAKPLEQLAANIRCPKSIQLKIFTKIESSSILHGSLDLPAIERFWHKFPDTRVNHLPGLHAKVYIADDHTAIITSGNLTSSSLSRNLEYGIRVNDRNQISEISQNMCDYEQFSTELSVRKLSNFSELSKQLVNTYRAAYDSTQIELKNELDKQLDRVQISIKELRGASGDSITSIFARTVFFVLRDGPLLTEEIHSRVQSLHPDLCDDSEDRIINGVYFGKLWKHHVRNAQQRLKGQKKIMLFNGKWQLNEAATRQALHSIVNDSDPGRKIIPPLSSM